ncbi:MAG: fibronectin type III domain-containing protein, partial [Nocardioidaceae bacterium]
TVDLRSSLTARVASGGRLNVAAAVGPPGCDPGFYLRASPSTQRVPVGSATDVSYSLLVAPVGGFSGLVDLSVNGLPSGATATLGPSRVVVTDPSAAASTITVRTHASTPAGSYVLIISGNDGLMASASAVTLHVQAPDFSLETSGDPRVFPGETANLDVTATPRAAFSGLVDLTVEGLAPASSATFAPNPISLGGAGPTGSVLAVSTTEATPAGTYVLTVRGTGNGVHAAVDVTLVVRPPDFEVFVADESGEALQGESATYPVTVSSRGGFSGSLTLSVVGEPTGSAVAFEPSPIDLPPQGSASSTLVVSTTAGTPPGTHSLSITVDGGSVSHTVGVSLEVRPRGLVVSVDPPMSRVVGRVSSTTYQVGLVSTGFTGSVQLSATGLPAGTSETFGSNPVALSDGASASSILTITTSGTTPIGTYAITVSGVNGSTTSSGQASLIVEPAAFLIAGNPRSRQVAPGMSTTYTLTTGSTFGFSGKVAYSLSGLPAGAAGLFSLNPVSLSAETLRTSTLSITTGADTPPGHYALSITGSKGASVRKQVLTLNVVPAPAAPLGVSATGVSESRINLGWNPVAGATSYKVYRAANSGGPYSHIASVTSTSYANTSLTANTAYYYVVRTVSGTAVSPDSFPVSATTATGPGAPGTPTNLSAVAVAGTSNDLSWTAVSGATGYRVFRSPTRGGPYTKIASTTTPGYSDTGVKPEKTYHYVVRSFSGSGTSGTSQELAVEAAG